MHKLTNMERHYFLGGNTPQGFVGFYKDVVDSYNLSKLYILKGASGTGKATFMRKFAREILKKHADTDVDYILCGQDPKSLDGVIFPKLGLGIIDGTHPHVTDPKYPGVVEEIVDLAKYIDGTKVNRVELQRLLDKKSSHYAKAYKELDKAKREHDKIEKIYGEAMDFRALDTVLEEMFLNIL